jgi:16S rRNA (guanine527-N7)-methyltransferase
MTRRFPGVGWSPSEDLLGVLASAESRGAIGPAPLADHVAHALGFLAAWPKLERASAILDLGSGGGLPGLVLAARLPGVQFCLLDGRVERAHFLETAVRKLGWTDRVRVVAERAETAAHRPELRGAFSAVVARGFGHPAATVECGAGFLGAAGVLVVSGPPGGGAERWPAGPLGMLGLELAKVVASPRSFAILRSVTPCPEGFPRRVGAPEHRPLF